MLELVEFLICTFISLSLDQKNRKEKRIRKISRLLLWWTVTVSLCLRALWSLCQIIFLCNFPLIVLINGYHWSVFLLSKIRSKQTLLRALQVFYVPYHGDFQLVDSMDWLSILPEGFCWVLYEDTYYFHSRICLLKLFWFLFVWHAEFYPNSSLSICVIKANVISIIVHARKQYLCYGHLSIL